LLFQPNQLEKSGGGFRQPTLVTRGGVAVNQSLPRCTVVELDCGETLVGRPIRGALEGGTESRALSAIANRGSAGFPHVFLG
jgi:hypothetical protein